MKKILSAIALVVAGFMFASCGSTNNVATTGSDDIPEWYILEPDSKDGIYAVGQAKMADLDVSVKMATANARTELANKVKVTVQAVTQTMTSGSQTDAIKGFEENALQKTEASLVGSKRTNYYKAKDGTVYIQMFLPFETQINALNETAKEYKLNEEYWASQAKMEAAYDKYFSGKN